MAKGASLEFEGSFSIGKGTIRIEKKGRVIIGSDFIANNNFALFADKDISFGNHVLIGWNV